jgi:hypothetical protein
VVICRNRDEVHKTAISAHATATEAFAETDGSSSEIVRTDALSDAFANARRITSTLTAGSHPTLHTGVDDSQRVDGMVHPNAAIITVNRSVFAMYPRTRSPPGP